jgi:hypothetical protein
MPTPASGAISMNDMNVEITRASGTATVSMDTIRTRYGGSGAISFSDLRSCEGFVITAGSDTGKFGTTEGWTDDFIGSISPDENSGRIQFAANSFLYACASPAFSNTVTYVQIESSPTVTNFNGDLVTAGFKATNISRVVLANTSRSITAQTSNSTISQAEASYDFPGSGTIHCLLKF